MRKIKSGASKIKSGVIKQTIPLNFQKAIIKQTENKRIENCKNNLDVVHLKGVTYGLSKAFQQLYPKINFHCIGKYQKIITNIINYSDKLFNELNKRNLELDSHFIAIEFNKLYDIEEKILAKRTDCKVVTINQTGVPKETLKFFDYIYYTYEIINKLLVIHPYYKKQEIKFAKYIRTYCKKLYEFIEKEIESDMEVAV